MDDKTMELFQQGKYLKGLKQYIEVAAEETPTARQFSETLPPNESPTPNNHMSQTRGRNSQMVQQQRTRGISSQQTHQQRIVPNQHSLTPSHKRITKESIIKFDRNSSAGSVALALFMIIILLFVFFYTL